MLFAQIQGSARIRLEDGTILRVNYDSHNGWPYTPVGRVLVDHKIMTKDQVSMQSIRDWMEANPDQAKDVRRQNKSYVFFRITDLATEDEAVGGEGVPLVPGRSIAIDRALHVYGTPFFIQADLPIANEKAATKFGRLVVAQDTGSAIVGPARADIYFGAGDEAARIAGRIKNPGAVRHAAAARARSGRGRPRYAAAAGAAGKFSFNFSTMDDPTATAKTCRCRKPKPAVAPAPAPKPKAKRGEKMSRRRQLSDEEQALWTGFVRSIKPLRASKQAAKCPTGPLSPPREVAAVPPPLPRRGRVPRRRQNRPRSRRSTAGSSSAWRAAATQSTPASICMA